MTETTKANDNVILTSGDAVAVLWHWELMEKFAKRHNSTFPSFGKDRPCLKLIVLEQNQETLEIEERTHEQVKYSGCSIETSSKTSLSIVRLRFHDPKYHNVDCYWRAGDVQPPASRLDTVLFHSIEFNPKKAPDYSSINLTGNLIYNGVMRERC